jgi:hypothetical protein
MEVTYEYYKVVTSTGGLTKALKSFSLQDLISPGTFYTRIRSPLVSAFC